MKKTFIASTVLALSCVLLGTGCSASQDEPLTVQGFFFDTIVDVQLYGVTDKQILKDCTELMEKYENLFSRTREGSDIWNINHSKGQPVEVSDETIDIIEDALEYCISSDGLFDIAIAPVTSLWNFVDTESPSLPDSEALEEALTHVDYNCIQIEGNTVTLTDPDSGIDLGAIAKGYISDRLKDLVVSEGCTSGLINLGGNVMTIGSKPNGSAWNIGIRKPFGTSAYDLSAKVAVSDMSVITSGTYERYFELDGITYHHILDPKTGYPVDNDLTSVSILTKDGTQGDALSTTCFALGVEKGMEFIESIDSAEAMFIDSEGNQTYSTGWPVE